MSEFDKIQELQEELKKQKEKYFILEEEADLLALENERLRELLQSHGIDPMSITSNELNYDDNDNINTTITTTTTTTTTTTNNSIKAKKFNNSDTFFEQSDGKYPTNSRLRINNASGQMNGLSVAYGSFNGNELDAIISGGVDKVLRVYDLTGAPRGQFEFSAPILAIETFGSLISCTFMDGGHALVDLATNETQIYKTHTKYVISTGWSKNGDYLYTCSHDKSIAIFHVQRTIETTTLELVKKLYFNETPECACFVPTDTILTTLHESLTEHHQNLHSSSSSTTLSLPIVSNYEIPFLIIGIRNVSYLIYYSVELDKLYHISMNENIWDTHISFTPLYLSLSNNMKYLAIATDKNMHLVLRTGSHQRIHLLVGGHTSNEYYKPKIVWNYNDLEIISLSQADYSLHVYTLWNGKSITLTTNTHTGQIKDLKLNLNNKNILTTSFDKSVVEWTIPETI